MTEGEPADGDEITLFIRNLLHQPEHKARVTEILRGIGEACLFDIVQQAEPEQVPTLTNMTSNVVGTMYAIGLNIPDITDECKRRLVRYEGAVLAFQRDEMHRPQQEAADTVRMIKDVTNSHLSRYFGRTV